MLLGFGRVVLDIDRGNGGCCMALRARAPERLDTGLNMVVGSSRHGQWVEESEEDEEEADGEEIVCQARP
jgi:hypothetical protein